MNYVYAGYGITLAVVVLYAVRVLARGRALRRALPPDER
jgi:heme exporter protein D